MQSSSVSLAFHKVTRLSMPVGKAFTGYNCDSNLWSLTQLPSGTRHCLVYREYANPPPLSLLGIQPKYSRTVAPA